MSYDFLKDLLPKSIIATNLKFELDHIKTEGYFVLKSGTNNLDLLLGGGFRSKKSYIIYGANSTGKTQLCHQLCIEAFKIGIKTIYIDTENTFRPERIKELCSYSRLNEDEVLKTILVASASLNCRLSIREKPSTRFMTSEATFTSFCMVFSSSLYFEGRADDKYSVVIPMFARGVLSSWETKAATRPKPAIFSCSNNLFSNSFSLVRLEIITRSVTISSFLFKTGAA